GAGVPRTARVGGGVARSGIQRAGVVGRGIAAAGAEERGNEERKRRRWRTHAVMVRPADRLSNAEAAIPSPRNAIGDAILAYMASSDLDFRALSREWVRAMRGPRSQTALSRRLGYRTNVIYRWESGARSP